jgi:hypothetical protein
MWYLCWTKWRWYRFFFSELFGFLLWVFHQGCPCSSWWWTVSPLVAAVQRHSLTPSTWTRSFMCCVNCLVFMFEISFTVLLPFTFSVYKCFYFTVIHNLLRLKLCFALWWVAFSYLILVANFNVQSIPSKVHIHLIRHLSFVLNPKAHCRGQSSSYSSRKVCLFLFSPPPPPGFILKLSISLLAQFLNFVCSIKMLCSCSYLHMFLLLSYSPLKTKHFNNLKYILFE